MVDARHPFSRFTVVAALTSALVAGGCVKSSTFRDEVATLRTEMQNGDAESRAQAAAAAAAATDVDRRLSSRIDAMEGRMMALENGLRTLEGEFDAQVDRFEQAIRFQAPIHFAFDGDQIESNEAQVLRRVAAVVREFYPQALITVEGFTDPSGSAAYNLRLGQRRADAVKAELLTLGGLADGQIRAVSYGEDTSRLIRPGSQGPGDAGRENRRVVIVIDHPTAWGAAATMSSTGDSGTD
jgi:peptidoglycan-associated lipoprotein